MAHTFENDEALCRRKIDNAILEINQESSIQNKEEFINVLMLVPMIFPLHHRQPDDRIVHLAKRLVVPFVLAGVGKLLHIDQLKRTMQNVEISLVWEFFSARLGIHAANLTAEGTEVAEKTRRNCVCDLCVLSGEVKLFFAVEIISFPTLYNYAVCR
jgi:hypothetical protein